MNRRALRVVTCVLVLGSLHVRAQEFPPYGRVVIASTSRWGDGLSGVVENLGPGRMCSVVIQANPFVEDNPLAPGDYGTTKAVTQGLGTLEANQEAAFSLNSVFVKRADAESHRHGIAVSIIVGWAASDEDPATHRNGKGSVPTLKARR